MIINHFSYNYLVLNYYYDNLIFENINKNEESVYNVTPFYYLLYFNVEIFKKKYCFRSSIPPSIVIFSNNPTINSQYYTFQCKYSCNYNIKEIYFKYFTFQDSRPTSKDRRIGIKSEKAWDREMCSLLLYYVRLASIPELWNIFKLCEQIYKHKWINFEREG